MRQCTFCGFKTDAPYDSAPLYEHSKTHVGKKGFNERGMWKEYKAEFSKRFVRAYGLLFVIVGFTLGILVCKI